MTKKVLFLAYIVCISMVCATPLQGTDTYWLPKGLNSTFQSFWQWEHKNTAIATALAGMALWSLWRSGTLQIPSLISQTKPNIRVEPDTTSNLKQDLPTSTSQSNVTNNPIDTTQKPNSKQEQMETIYSLFDRKFILSQTDITNVPDKAIVNAANPNLLCGGGVCGAIFRTSQYPQKLQNACNRIIAQRNNQPLPAGEAVITPSYYDEQKSPVLYIIHAVGPNVNIGQTDTNLIKKAYLNSLQLAQKNHITSIAFPLISAAIYGFTDLQNYGGPLNPVAPALQAFQEFAQNNPNSKLQTIRLAIPDKNNYQIIKDAIAQHHSQRFIKQPQIAAEQTIKQPYLAITQYAH